MFGTGPSGERRDHQVKGGVQVQGDINGKFDNCVTSTHIFVGYNFTHPRDITGSSQDPESGARTSGPGDGRREDQVEDEARDQGAASGEFDKDVSRSLCHHDMRFFLF